MVTALVLTAATVLQAASNPHITRSARLADPVRVARADSTAFITLPQTGHVMLLHVDAIGRIEVLYPLVPEDTFAVSAATPLAVDLPPTAQANPATFVAVWSRWSFDFSGMRAGSTWNYDALLLQPTAGDPLAALLDIADRITDGRPYEYGVATYSRSGTAVARGPVAPPDVCLSCVRRAPEVASAPAAASTAVDCSNASMTNSFCGVNSGSVSITSAPPQVVYETPPPAAPAPVYVPYFMPWSHGFRRRFEPAQMPPQRMPMSQGVAYPIAPRLVVPTPSQITTFGGRHH